PIFFEFDSAEITPEAALELDRLVRVMEEHPEMKIQVRAHTDSRGSHAYNLALSDRRAKSTANYIIGQGIDASRISGEGFGETMPKVECGTNCTDEQFQQNRRSEFKIVKE
ncbi:MAG TPA: OmpA family protein, partial [Flavobacteriaceae bacterium]|nr:OmpA family protein [Flavobacteriaceae bacterium]